ncbi:MAG: type II toxin-antitoxin system VapC family toxin [Pirellulaceae bacterium]|nr:type II toxin-antitoxin system VapC family toxin [Pirellulaceae bacterium]
MKYLLDTNICVFVIRRKSPQVLVQLEKYAADEVGVSAVTVAELRYGADKSERPAQNHAALDAFLVPLVTVDFGSEAAECYGKIRSQLERRGTPIGPLDTMIAAHSLCLGVPLVTNNTIEFSRVPGLQFEDWTLSTGSRIL